MTPLMGFAPDMETPTPGVLVDCVNFIPYESGMESAPSAVTPLDVPALAAECLGAASVSKIDGTKRVFAGTTTKLYELTGGAWADRSAGTYSGGADTRWSFAQFGDSTIAANKADAMQVSNSSTFAAVGGSSPKAEIVFSVNAFVMALNVNDGADKPDGWHCCAIFDATDWVEAVATQSASGRLVATSGPLTAGLRLGEYAVAYKSRSIYLGQYVGAPAVWDWILVPGGNAGCVGKEAICDVDQAHFFVGADNFWLFDGTRPVPVGDEQVRQWFFDSVDPASIYKTKCVFDRQQNRVWIFYPPAGSSVCSEALVYHLKKRQWGRATLTIEAAFNYSAGGLSFDSWDDAGASFDALPSVSFDSAYWLAGASSLGVFNTSHQLQTLTGIAGASSFTTGDAGDDDAVTLLKQVRLRFASGRKPTTATIQTYHAMSSGEAFTTGVTGTINDGKFDVLKAARWHRATVSMTGSARVTGIKPEFEIAGAR